MIDGAGSSAPLQASRISPLARRLVIFTVGFSTLVALLTTAIQLCVDYQRQLDQVESTFQQVADTHLATIASALWGTNQQELQIAVDGLSRLPDVHYVAVTEQNKVWAESGQQKNRSVKSRDYQMSDLNRAIEVMTQHRGLGVHLSLDDLGTDYSSPAYFRRFPVNTLKMESKNKGTTSTLLLSCFNDGRHHIPLSKRQAMPA